MRAAQARAGGRAAACARPRGQAPARARGRSAARSRRRLRRSAAAAHASEQHACRGEHDRGDIERARESVRRDAVRDRRRRRVAPQRRLRPWPASARARRVHAPRARPARCGSVFGRDPDDGRPKGDPLAARGRDAALRRGSSRRAVYVTMCMVAACRPRVTRVRPSCVSGARFSLDAHVGASAVEEDRDVAVTGSPNSTVSRSRTARTRGAAASCVRGQAEQRGADHARRGLAASARPPAQPRRSSAHSTNARSISYGSLVPSSTGSRSSDTSSASRSAKPPLVSAAQLARLTARQAHELRAPAARIRDRDGDRARRPGSSVPTPGPG